MRKFSLGSRLSLAMVMVVLLTVALISFLSNYLIQDQFRDYVTHQQEKMTQQFVDSISLLYNSSTGVWNEEQIRNIGMTALNDGYIMKVYDSEGAVLWDAEACDMELCIKIKDEITHRMLIQYPEGEGGLVTKDYPVLKDFKDVGTVSVEYYGPFFYNQEDFLFLDSLNKILIGIGALSLVISIVTGIVLARHLSKPILRTVEVAQDIAAGRYGARIRENSGTEEVDRLIDAINHMAQSLEKQETLRRQLTADVAHELRAPLTTVQTHIEAMQEGIWEPTPERLESCYDELDRLGKLVSDLENLAKVESDNLKLNKTKTDLLELTKKALGLFEKGIRDKELQVEMDGSCSDISADPDRISQVLVNLISNAVKYTPDRGAIKITLSDAGDSVVFHITDNGIGIPEEELPYIFERFYRADKSRNRNTGGAGIGLAIVKSIVTAHGGTVDVKSRINEGSSFIITLPR